MTGELLAVGVDPGPTPGIVALRWSGVLLEHAVSLQCGPAEAPELVAWILERETHPDLRAVVQVERFVVGRGSQKSGRAGAITRDLVGAITREVALHSTHTRGYDTTAVQRNASQVKQWATDARLMAVAGVDQTDLYRLTAGMRHARDAARHALFVACHDGGIPDPLSTRTPQETR